VILGQTTLSDQLYFIGFIIVCILVIGISVKSYIGASPLFTVQITVMYVTRCVVNEHHKNYKTFYLNHLCMIIDLLLFSNN